MSVLGESFLAGMLLLCSFAAVLSLAVLKLELETAKRVFICAKAAMLIAVGFSVVVLVLLIFAFLTDDFSIAAVARHSSVELPFFYKLSAVWAGSAGSLVLWSVGGFVLFGLWLAKTKVTEIKFGAAALSIGAGVCLGFSVLLFFLAKPFTGSVVTVSDGAGLNPLLRNFWMIIHPPLLFIGYSAFLIAFVIVLAKTLAGGVEDSAFYGQLRRWLLAGICFLGFGIAAGAKWSYVEPRWGGYWTWDPVENVSLLPWLIAVAALHSLTGIRHSERFKFWTIVLAPVPFILCLVAAFVTRSGVLQSVHSFDGGTMFSALLVFIGCCFLLWLICVVRAAKGMSIRLPYLGVPILNTGSLLCWAGLLLVFAAAVIGAATFWPLIWRAVAGSRSGFFPKRAFYDMVVSAVGAILAFLVGLSVLAELKKRRSIVLEALCCSAAGLLSGSVVFKQFNVTLLVALACGVCAFSCVAVLTKLWVNLKTGGGIGGQVAHLGLLLLVVAAGFSSYEQTLQTQLAKGGKMMFGGKYEFVYDSLEHKSSGGITKVGPEIILTKKGLTKKLWPHNSFYPNNQKTSEPAIHTGLFEDVYILFDDVYQDDKVVIVAKVKPLMLWLWIAFVLIVAGSALAMLEGKKGREI